MKTIGLIGGLSWESSLEYYRLINEEVAKRLGGYHSAKVVMLSLDFSEIEALSSQARWSEISIILVESARKVEQAGADFLLLCCNTMHKLADDIQAGITIPMLHIADAVGMRARAMNINKLGLLGTRITMEDDFYRSRLGDRFHLEVIIPDAGSRQVIQKIIYEELVHGKILSTSRDALLLIMVDLQRQGAQGIVLGCTEIGLLVDQAQSSMPFFDTTRLHAKAAVDWSLASD